jgi:ABC-type sugar transport system ATPase subunit
VQALKDVQLRLHKGEVLALVGENGAGKSTLMNILLGSIQPNGGSITLKGEKYAPKSTAEALEKGISMIHQELTLVPEMTITENIWLGREGDFTKFGYLDVHKRDRATKKLLTELDINIDYNIKATELSVAQMQLVELARAVSYNAEVIIMDEPTSSFTNREIEKLYKIVKSLSEKGVSIIFITHKLDEVFTVCDNVAVLRDGQYIGTYKIKELTQDELIAMMVGREINDLYPKQEVDIGETVFEVEGLSRKGYFEDVSFAVKRGEILGFCGLIGAGRSEIMECIFGLEHADSGEIRVHGKSVKHRSTKDAINNGIAMVTEDRLRRGLIHMLSVRFNISLAYLDQICKAGFINRKTEMADCEKIGKQLSVKMSSLEQEAGLISGGNQQKALICKCLLTEPNILILDEPTRGIDVGSKAEIYRLIGELAAQGKAIILVSSELPELMGISDRIVVMSKGKKMAELPRTEFNEKSLITYAFGGF